MIIFRSSREENLDKKVLKFCIVSKVVKNAVGRFRVEKSILRNRLRYVCAAQVVGIRFPVPFSSIIIVIGLYIDSFCTKFRDRFLKF